MDDVPVALQTRLGPDASRALLDMLDRSHAEARDAIMTACTERFDQRLSLAESGLRQDMANLGASLRQDMATLGAALRGEMAELRASLREEMAGRDAALRGEMTELRATLREDLANVRVDLLKWSFLFWVGQVLAVGGMLGVALRLLR